MSNIAVASDVFGGGAFAPPSAKTIQGANLLAWWRANDAATVTLDGSNNVSALADQSGTGDTHKNASQSTANIRPAYVLANAGFGGKSTLNITGAQRLVTGVWTVPPTQPLTIFVVGGGSAGDYWYDSLDASHQFTMFGGTGILIAAGGSSIGGGQGAIAADHPVIIWAIYDGASSTLGVGQNTPIVTGNAGANVPTGFTIGDYAGGLGLSIGGDFAEMIVVSGHLSAGKIAEQTAQLAAFYGLTQGP